MKRSRTSLWVIGLATVLLALLPVVCMAVEEPYYRDLAIRILIFAIAAVSLDLILGYGGMISFGHAAYLGIGSYVVGIMAYYGVKDGLAHLIVALLACALIAAAIGAISLRTVGVYFIMITLAFTQMLYFLALSVSKFGGDEGLSIAAPSNFYGILDLSNPNSLYYTTLVTLFAVLALSKKIISSHFGIIIRGIKSNERKMAALGFDCFRYKLAAFVIAGTMCGLAGVLLANQSLFVTPSIMHWTRSGEVMMMVILGGVGTLLGPAVGAAVILLAEDIFSSFTQYWQVIFGPFVIVIVMFARRGLLGSIKGIHIESSIVVPDEAPAKKVPAQWQQAEAVTGDKTLLSANALNKRFDGVRATQDVSLDVKEGELHAIIGPNGAGKTTLIGQLAGYIRPDSGTIVLGSRDISVLSMQKRCEAGIARTFQITSIFKDISAVENVILAVLATRRSGFQFWHPVSSDRALINEALETLDTVGLRGRANVRAGALSYGEQRALEIALALANKPRLILLDEPMSGMGGHDAQRIVTLLENLKGKVTMILIEHDMEAVFALADHITVLVYGKVIASGAPGAISQDEEVKKAYLGEQLAAA